MKLLIMPKSIDQIESLIEDIDGVIVGIKDLSINQPAYFTLDEIKKINEIIKNNGKEIFVSLNKNMFNKDLKELTNFLKEVDKLNIDGIFFYDLSILNIAKNINLKTNLVWNQNYFVNNYETCNYYYDKDIKYGVISNEITKEEIEKLVKNTKMNMFINVFGYQMMSYSKRKLISNYFKFIKNINLKKYHKLIENDKTFIIKEEKYGTCFLSDYVLCYVDYLNYFNNIGIKGIILNEDNIEKDKFLNIIKIYKDSIYSKDLNFNKIKQIVPNVSIGFLNKKTIFKVKN